MTEGGGCVTNGWGWKSDKRMSGKKRTGGWKRGQRGRTVGRWVQGRISNEEINSCGRSVGNSSCWRIDYNQQKKKKKRKSINKSQRSPLVHEWWRPIKVATSVHVPRIDGFVHLHVHKHAHLRHCLQFSSQFSSLSQYASFENLPSIVSPVVQAHLGQHLAPQQTTQSSENSTRRRRFVCEGQAWALTTTAALTGMHTQARLLFAKSCTHSWMCAADTNNTQRGRRRELIAAWFSSLSAAPQHEQNQIGWLH